MSVSSTASSFRRIDLARLRARAAAPSSPATATAESKTTGRAIQELPNVQLLFHGQRVGGTDGVCPVTIGGEPGTDVDLSLHDLERAAEWMDATLVRRGVLRVAYDIHAIKAEQSVRGQFVTDVLESDLPDEMRERVLVTGPRALDRRGDLEVVYGPNESAKTAIHAGIHAALCGVRRARGAPARRRAAG